MFDKIQVVLWSITYLLIVINIFKNKSTKSISIPYLAVILNFAWEFNALIQSNGMWGHILWISLDFVILIYGFYTLSSRNKIVYIALILLFIVVLFYVFKLNEGDLVSCFVIDLIMAAMFLIRFNYISKNLKISIALTKLLGDLFAWQFYKFNIIVNIIGIIVLVINLIYFFKCINSRQDLIEKVFG